MAQAPPLAIVKTGYQSHIPHFTELMTTPEGQAWMTEQARQTMGIEGAKSLARLLPFTLAVDEHLARRSVSPTGSVRQADTRSTVVKKMRPANPTRSGMTRPLPAQPTTPAIRVENERPFAVAQATPLPTHHQPQQVSPAPQKPTGNEGFAGFPGVQAQSTKVYCSCTCRIVGGVSGNLTFYHVMPFLKSPQDPIEQAPRTPRMKKSQCKVCDAVDHLAMGDCPKFQQLVARGVERIVQARPAPSPSPPRRRESTSRGLDPMSEDHFSGYDEPRPSRRDTQGGNGGNIPPGGGNVAGGDDPGDSDSSCSCDDSSSSLPDLSKFLGRKKSLWTDAKKRRYDERSQALADFLRKSKKSQSRQKKSEKLGIKGFTGNPLDTQRFIQDAEIRCDYFRHCKLIDIDKVSLIIALLEGDAQVWSNSIHVHISEEAALRARVPFNKDNELRTWIGFRKRLKGSFGGHSDRDHAVN